MRGLTPPAHLALASLLLAPALCGLVAGRPSMAASLLGGVLVLGGILAIPRRRRGVDCLVISISTAAMLVGLLIDSRAHGPGGLAALCLARGGDGVLAVLRADLATMPTTCALMMIAGLGTSLATSRVIVPEIAICTVAMPGGMLLSDLVLHRLVHAGAAFMFAAMPGGMVWGMVWGLVCRLAWGLAGDALLPDTAPRRFACDSLKVQP